MGGFWERMIGITKQCLRKTIELMFEELRKKGVSARIT